MVTRAGMAITISGLTTPQSGSYNVSLDKEPPITVTFPSPRPDFASPTLLYSRTGLDPSVMHKLSIVNVGVDASSNFLAVGSVNVTNLVHTNGT